MEAFNKYTHHTFSYLHLRKTVGWIGILLPFVLMLGVFAITNTTQVEESISHYYHTDMRNVFVGALSAVALFLFFYCGYDSIDHWISNFAAFFAIGTALFPTTFAGPIDGIGMTHFVCASSFFLMLASLSLFRFTKGAPNPSSQKLHRNKIYIVCGSIMIACLLAVVIYFKFFEDPTEPKDFVFWAESVALIAFGISWLTKGGTIIPDTLNEESEE